MVRDVHEEPARREPRRRSRWIRIAAIAVGVVALGAAVLWWVLADDAAPPSRQPGKAPPAMSVRVLTVTPRSVPLSSRFLAQTEASQTVPIRARVAGFLVERAFDEGQHVEQGQLLFRIEAKPFEVALRQAEAQLAAAEARLQQAERQVRRFETLAEQQSAAESELEQAQESRAVAAADVALQQARVEQARLDLDYTTIESPIDGVIGRAEQDVGSYIGPNANAMLATVLEVDPLRVRFSVSEQAMLRWQRLVGAGTVDDVPIDEFVVTLVLPDGREYPRAGHIDFVDVAFDPSTGTALVRATVPNPDDGLLPGQFVNAVVTGATRRNAVLVPQSAVVQTPMGSSVYVLDEENVVQLRPVVPGEWYGEDWIIDSGLEPGDRVVVDRLMQVRPGTTVVPEPAG